MGDAISHNYDKCLFLLILATEAIDAFPSSPTPELRIITGADGPKFDIAGYMKDIFAIGPASQACRDSKHKDCVASVVRMTACLSKLAPGEADLKARLGCVAKA